MFKVIRKNDASVRKISNNKIAINYITKEVSPDVSLAVTEVTNFEEKQKTEYNRIYYILKGTLILSFDDEEIRLEKGDSCHVSKGTEYLMSGTFKAIVVNQPAFGT
ncbi:cupin domain-containing protein [Patescibacteria group bacterium]